MKVQAIGIDCWKDRSLPDGFGQTGSRRQEEAILTDQLVPMRRTCDLPGWHGSVLCPPSPYSRSSFVLS
jgi:hypothetical protein